MRKTVLGAALAVAAVVLASPTAAGAAVGGVFDGHTTGAGPIACAPEGDVRFCEGSTANRVLTFDGVPLDVNVTLPAEPSSGADGPYPLLMIFHGWGGSKAGLATSRPWAERGYAVLTMTNRGFGNSCGSLASRAHPGCAEGHIRLMDTRREVRDAQHLAGLLADQVDSGTRLVDPQRIGATGGSYGGAQSMSLAALRNRVMTTDGTLEPWTSPSGAPMRIAAAAPDIPWTDLAYSLVPNGRTLDYVADSPYGAPFGVLKESFVAGLYALGSASGFYAAPGTDPTADLTTWYTRVNAGEPYDGDPTAEGIAEEITRFHSSYYIDDSVPPAPLLISNGWTDDLFPADEALRYYHRTRTRHPGARVSLFFLDYGHQRAQNKAADVQRLRDRQVSWFAHHLRGDGPQPVEGVEVLTQECGTVSRGPFTAPTWAELPKGEVRFETDAEQTILSAAGDATIAQAFDPIAGPGACATTTAEDQAGIATYRLPAAGEGGYTVMGSPTVIADLDVTPTHHGAQVAARLLDVDPGGDQTLIARGLYRPKASGEQVFQLHPNGYTVPEGHVLKLELLGQDKPYGRQSNSEFTVTVNGLELRVPVLEAPGQDVQAPAEKVVPEGYELASDFAPPPDGNGGGNGGGGGDGGTPGAAPGPAPTAPTGQPPADAFAPQGLGMSLLIAPRLVSQVSRSRTFTVRWSPSTAAAWLVRGYELQGRRISTRTGRPASDWLTVRRTRETSTRLTGRYGETYQLRVRALDARGRGGEWRTGGRVIVPLNATTGFVRHSRGWARARGAGAFAGSLAQARRRGASISLRMPGRRMAIIAPVSPRGGAIRVSVGSRSATVSLRSRRAGARRVVFVTPALRPGSALRITALSRGTSLDAFAFAG